MLQISVGCIYVLARPKTWHLDHIKFWELRRRGPKLCPNRGLPLECPTCLPAPHSASGTSSPQRLSTAQSPLVS